MIYGMFRKFLMKTGENAFLISPLDKENNVLTVNTMAEIITKEATIVQ